MMQPSRSHGQPAPSCVRASSSISSSVERLGKAHVGDGGVEPLGRLERRIEQRVLESQDRRRALSRLRRISPLPQACAHHLLLRRHAGASAARIAHRRRAVVLERRVQRLAAFVFIGRREHGHVGNAAQ